MTPPTDIPTPAALGLAARAARKQLSLTQPQLALAAVWACASSLILKPESRRCGWSTSCVCCTHWAARWR